jgi:hypothetical protein
MANHWDVPKRSPGRGTERSVIPSCYVRNEFRNRALSASKLADPLVGRGLLRWLG